MELLVDLTTEACINVKRFLFDHKLFGEVKTFCVGGFG